MVSDGASYGNLGVDRSEVTAFQRWDYARPEFNLEVAVFPHGYIKNFGDGLKSTVKNQGSWVPGTGQPNARFLLYSALIPGNAFARTCQKATIRMRRDARGLALGA